MKEFWDDRYSKSNYAYGKAPNEFFKQEIEKLPVGKLLLPAEGEGRNAVYAASIGWDVHALDMSENGREKALMLASENKVSIKYDVCPIQDCKLIDNEYDAVVLIYAHFPPQLRKIIHQKLSKSLKPGGILLIEAFNKTQLGKKSGGPQDLDLLYSIDEMKLDFAGFKFVEAIETTINLYEGEYHKGPAEIIRIKALKN